VRKLECLGYQAGCTRFSMISCDILTQNWILTDRQMDRHFLTEYAALMHSITRVYAGS